MGATGLHLRTVEPKDCYVIVGGGFDLIHAGHFNLINDASNLGKVIVTANSDNFFIKKKVFFNAFF